MIHNCAHVIIQKHFFHNKQNDFHQAAAPGVSEKITPGEKRERGREKRRERERDREIERGSGDVSMTGRSGRRGGAPRNGQAMQLKLKDALSFMALPAYATESQVRVKYRELVRKVHPDKGGSPETFRRLQDCYDLILQRFGTPQRPVPTKEASATDEATKKKKKKRDVSRVGKERDVVDENSSKESSPDVYAVRQGEDQQQVVISSDLKQLGDEAFERGDFDEAVEYYDAAAAYSRIDNLISYAELLLARARAHSAAGHEEKALADGKRAVEMRPIWGEAYSFVGRLLLDQEEWLGARIHLEKAVHLLRESESRDCAKQALAKAHKALEEKYCVCTMRGHSSEVRQVSFFPQETLFDDSRCAAAELKEEKIVATSSVDCTVRIWSCISGKCIHTLKGHEAPICSFQWCPDGSGILVSASKDCTSKIWRISMSSCELLKTIEGHTGAVTHVTFDKYGSMFATTSEDCEACVWDTETGLLMHRLVGHTERLNKGSFHPTGRTFCTASDDTTARIWDLAGDVEKPGECVHTLEWGDGKVNDVEYTPDGRFVVMVTRKAGSVNPFFRLLLFSSVSGRICRWYDGHAATITGLSWNPSQIGSEVVTLATSSFDGTLKLWEIAAEPTGPGSYLLENDEFQGRLLHHWERPPSCKEMERMYEGALYCVAYNPTGDFLCAAGIDHHVRVFDSDTMECLQDCGGHLGPINSLAWSSDSSAVISTSSDQTVRIWNIVEL